MISEVFKGGFRLIFEVVNQVYRFFFQTNPYQIQFCEPIVWIFKIIPMGHQLSLFQPGGKRSLRKIAFPTMSREGKHRGESPSEMKNWVSLLKDHNTRIKLLSQQEKDLKTKQNQTNGKITQKNKHPWAGRVGLSGSLQFVQVFSDFSSIRTRWTLEERRNRNTEKGCENWRETPPSRSDKTRGSEPRPKWGMGMQLRMGNDWKK